MKQITRAQPKISWQRRLLLLNFELVSGFLLFLAVWNTVSTGAQTIDVMASVAVKEDIANDIEAMPDRWFERMRNSNITPYRRELEEQMLREIRPQAQALAWRIRRMGETEFTNFCKAQLRQAVPGAIAAPILGAGAPKAIGDLIIQGRDALYNAHSAHQKLTSPSSNTIALQRQTLDAFIDHVLKKKPEALLREIFENDINYFAVKGSNRAQILQRLLAVDRMDYGRSRNFFDLTRAGGSYDSIFADMNDLAGWIHREVLGDPTIDVRAVITGSIPEGLVPLMVSLDGSESKAEKPTYKWTLGGLRQDGVKVREETVSTTSAFDYRFEHAGSYTIALLVTDAYGRTDEVARNISLGRKMSPALELSANAGPAQVEIGDAIQAGMKATVTDVAKGSLVVEMKFGEEKVAEKTFAVSLEETEFLLSKETIVEKSRPKSREFVISARVLLDEQTAKLAGSRELSKEMTFPIEVTLPEAEEAREDQPPDPEVVNRFVGTWSITMELIEGGTIDEMPAEERRKDDVMTFEISKTAAGGLDVQTGFRVANVKIVGETLSFSHVGNPIEHIELTLSESDSWMSGTLETGSGPFKRWRLTADRR